MAPIPQEMMKNKGKLIKEIKKKDEKRRQAELFKKARELALMCGGEAAVLVVSNRNKEVFASGHPSADSVVDRFTQFAHCERNSNKAMHKEEKKCNLKDKRDDDPYYWWNKDVDKMGLEELEEFVEALEELKKMVQNKVDQENKPLLGG